MSLGEKIKEFREKAGLTQEELAERLDVQRNTVWRWENKKANLKADMLQRLATVLHIPSVELVSMEKEISQQMLLPLDGEIAQMKDNSLIETNAGIAKISLGNGKEIAVPATTEGYAFLKDVALKIFLASTNTNEQVATVTA